MRRLLRTLRRADDGFSLIELLAAMAIGGVVLAGVMAVSVNGVKGTLSIENRVDNAGRARYTLDRIVRLLDAQVCAQLTSTSDILTPPVFAGSTSNSATFFADLSGASGNPRKYTLTYVPKSGNVGGTFTIDSYAFNPTTKGWTTKVGPTNVLASDIVPATDAAGAALPIFTYFPYVTTGTPAQIGTVSATPTLSPLSAATAPLIVAVRVQFAAVSSTSHVDTAQNAKQSQHSNVSGVGVLSTFDADSTTPSACP